jgi:hypothetical protein
MERPERAPAQGRQSVEPERPAQVDDRQAGRRIHGGDPRRRLADGAVGYGQEENTALRHPEA